MQVPKKHREVCPAYGVPEIGTIFNGKGNFCKRRRREVAGGLGGLPPPPPRKFSDLKALKRHFQHSQDDSCVKKVP